MTTPSLTATVKTYEDMLNEIKNFNPWRGPALRPGVLGHLHAPQLTVHVTSNCNGEYKHRTVDCLCGENLNYAAFQAPRNQPWPDVWVGLEAFKQHSSERKAEARIREGEEAA